MRLGRNSVQRIIDDLAGATLGDLRRNHRLLQVAERMARDPSATVPQALGSDAEVQGCYRLMNNSDVTFEALHAAHAAATQARARDAGRVLVIHDTTPCCFESLAPEEVGYLQTGKAGFNLHYSLVVAADFWKRPLGVLHAETVHRTQKPRSRNAKGKKRKKSGTDTARKEHKEFDRWWRGVLSTHESLGDVDALHIADRESDSYELMAKARGAGVRFIFRSRTDRRARCAEDDPSGVWSTVREVARRCDGVLEREVPLSRRRGDGPPAQTKTHPPRKMRLARLRFAATRVVIPRPQYLLDPVPRELELSLVHVTEVDPPEGETAVEWLLYTTEAVDTAERIAAIVDCYRARWTIEELNAALKTGCAYEDREFESLHALLNVLALSLPIACEVLWLRSRARSTPEAPATEVVSEVQLEVLRHFSSYRLPAQPSAVDALLAVAALGGHLRRNGPPGWKVLLAGMSKLQALADGWQAALALSRKRRRRAAN